MISDAALNPFGHADDGAFIDITSFANHTRWLNEAMLAYSSVGMVLFVILILAAWWRAREANSLVMARVIAVPVAACVAYVVNDVIKYVFDEVRPCYALPHAYIIEACPAMNDYSFPSNHTAVAVGMAVAFFAYDRRFGVLASLAALVMAFSRVYNGAHYPHDVLVGAVIGIVCAVVTVALMTRYVPALIDKASRGRLRPLLTK